MLILPSPPERRDACRERCQSKQHEEPQRTFSHEKPEQVAAVRSATGVGQHVSPLSLNVGPDGRARSIPTSVNPLALPIPMASATVIVGTNCNRHASAPFRSDLEPLALFEVLSTMIRLLSGVATSLASADCRQAL
jgi:hypothetical protein